MKKQTGMIEVVAYIKGFKAIQMAAFQSLNDAKEFISKMQDLKTPLVLGYRMEEKEVQNGI